MSSFHLLCYRILLSKHLFCTQCVGDHWTEVLSSLQPLSCRHPAARATPVTVVQEHWHVMLMVVVMLQLQATAVSMLTSSAMRRHQTLICQTNCQVGSDGCNKQGIAGCCALTGRGLPMFYDCPRVLCCHVVTPSIHTASIDRRHKESSHISHVCWAVALALFLVYMCMSVCMYVCSMSWEPTEGQQTKFCLCQFIVTQHSTALPHVQLPVVVTGLGDLQRLLL